MIHDTGLYDSIFAAIPREILETFTGHIANRDISLSYAALLQMILDNKLPAVLPPLHPRLLSALSEDPSCRCRLFLAASLSPFIGIDYQDAKKKVFPAVTAAIKESLKLGAQYHYLDGVPVLFAATDVLKSSELLAGERFNGKTERVAIGKA